MRAKKGILHAKKLQLLVLEKLLCLFLSFKPPPPTPILPQKKKSVCFDSSGFGDGIFWEGYECQAVRI